jgi:hypothetical protein
MFTSTKWRATLIAQARYTEVPAVGTIEMERWLCAQHAGRSFLSHAWDCPKCNPEGLPPESITTRSCSEGEALFRTFLGYAEEVGLQKKKSGAKSRVHKADTRDRYTEKPSSSAGHLLALCRYSDAPKRLF